MGRYGFNLGEQTIITSDPYEEDTFVIYPVLVLLHHGGFAHARLTDHPDKTLCGRPVDYDRTFEAYSDNEMYLRSICRNCQLSIVRMKRKQGAK